MTECERIVKYGILPQNFFDEEIRCDFTVTSYRKKIWAVSLDLLLELDRVCKKHSIKFFLIAGTLLGAVRHKGFIPWDDDIDVGMMREDYERFVKIARNEFKYPYFFQIPYTDDGYFFSFAKLRNENTTGISVPFRFEHFNQGLFIDIFQIDNCKMEDVKQNFDKINSLILDNSNYMRKSSPDSYDVRRHALWSRRDPLSVYEEIQKIARTHENEETEYVNMSTCTVYPCEKFVWQKKDFDEIVEMEFEGYKFPCPKGYDSILATQYGDYMKFPPVEKRGTWHDKVIFDPDIAYRDYLNIYYDVCLRGGAL